ncbi:MAG: metalloregulator ArsR/SmtB family transcription factor [Saprospiraceae bacterium]|nr:metalloregulator ArsR/SmtB family transcription factor [Saprospiraceae bacterium]
MKKRDPFTAVADPTRREIVRILTDHPMSISGLADQFEMSRPAVSKHLKIMSECGVLETETVGRTRMLSINHMALQEISIWLANYEQFWNTQLDQLGSYLDKSE